MRTLTRREYTDRLQGIYARSTDHKDGADVRTLVKDLVQLLIERETGAWGSLKGEEDMSTREFTAGDVLEFADRTYDRKPDGAWRSRVCGWPVTWTDNNVHELLKAGATVTLEPMYEPGDYFEQNGHRWVRLEDWWQPNTANITTGLTDNQVTTLGVTVHKPEKRVVVYGLFTGVETHGSEKTVKVSVPGYCEPWGEKCDIAMIRRDAIEVIECHRGSEEFGQHDSFFADNGAASVSLWLASHVKGDKCTILVVKGGGQ